MGERADGRLVWLQLDPASTTTWSDAELLKALNQADGVVNLAGEPIAEKRWTATHRAVIEAEPSETTLSWWKPSQAWSNAPKVLVNASAIGFYESSLTERFLESSGSGGDFLASLCQRWEDAAAGVPAGVRQVSLRIGIVLAADGAPSARCCPCSGPGFGGPIGSGQQWMSWIHRTDLVRT